MTIISKSCFRQNTCLTKLLISCSLTWWIQRLTRTCGMKFKDFQAPVLFSSTFKALNLGEKIQVLSRMHGNPGYKHPLHLAHVYSKSAKCRHWQTDCRGVNYCQQRSTQMSTVSLHPYCQQHSPEETVTKYKLSGQIHTDSVSVACRRHPCQQSNMNGQTLSIGHDKGGCSQGSERLQLQAAAVRQSG